MPKETPGQRKKVFWSPWKVHFIAQFDFYKIWHLKSLALPHPSIERLSNFYIFSLWPLFLPRRGRWEPFCVDCHTIAVARPFLCPIWVCRDREIGGGSRKDASLSGLVAEVVWLVFAFLLLQLSCPAFVVRNCCSCHPSFLWLSLDLFWKCCWNEQRVVWTERFQSLPAVFTQKLHDVATCIFPVFQLRSICPRFSRTHAVFAARTFSKLNWLDSTFARLVLWNASLNCSKNPGCNPTWVWAWTKKII